jgi:hypothetical protein
MLKQFKKIKWILKIKVLKVLLNKQRCRIRANIAKLGFKKGCFHSPTITLIKKN